MTPVRMRAVALAALVCGAGTVAVVLTSDREDADVAWAILGPLVIWSFVGTGLYAWRRRPESRVGALMVLLGFAWCIPALTFANPPLVYTFALVAGGVWGGVFLQLVLTFPSGRIASGRDRAMVIAGYLIFTARVGPRAAVRRPGGAGCDDCPDNLLLVRRDPDVADVSFALQAALYVALFAIVLVRLALRWRRARGSSGCSSHPSTSAGS